jgi:hypothetical protein
LVWRGLRGRGGREGWCQLCALKAGRRHLRLWACWRPGAGVLAVAGTRSCSSCSGLPAGRAAPTSALRASASRWLDLRASASCWCASSSLDSCGSRGAPG